MMRVISLPLVAAGHRALQGLGSSLCALEFRTAASHNETDMGRSFWKAILISLAAYAIAVFIGVWGDFRWTAFAIAALQMTWTLFCIVRVVQLRRGGGHKPDAPPYDRNDYEFALGGSVSSLTFLAAIVVLTQVV
jgi:hypothetical protein